MAPPESIVQANVQFSFVAWNVNVATGEVLCAAGVVSRMVVGFVVSIVHDQVAGLVSRLPSGSTAATAKVCALTASPVTVTGELQADAVAPSSEQTKLTSPEPTNANVALV